MTMSELEVVHLFAITDHDAVDHFVSDLASTGPELIFEHPAVKIVAVRSGITYREPVGDRHRIIDLDLDRLRAISPVIGASRPELDGRPIGSRWPVVVEHEPGAAFGPDDVEVDAGWDNALLRRCSPDLERRLLQVVAVVLARYRVLHETISVCRSLVAALVQAADDALPEGDFDRFMVERHALMAGRVLADPRPDLYWGCENRLLVELRTAWSIGPLEQAADEAVATTSALWDARNARISRAFVERQTVAAGRAATTLRLLALLSGVSALAGLIEFGGSGGPFHWSLARPLLSVVLMVVFVVLLMVSRSKSFRSRGDVETAERARGRRSEPEPTQR